MQIMDKIRKEGADILGDILQDVEKEISVDLTIEQINALDL